MNKLLSYPFNNYAITQLRKLRNWISCETEFADLKYNQQRHSIGLKSCFMNLLE